MLDKLRDRLLDLLDPLQLDEAGWPMDAADLERDTDEPDHTTGR